MLVKIVTALAALAAAAVALPADGYVLHEKRDGDPSDWFWRREAPSHHILPVRIGMTQSNLDKGHDLLMEVSHHESPKYGQHYTAEEVIDMFAPSQSTVDAIRAWLESSGISDVTISRNKQWMQFDTPTAKLESLLKTKFHEYEHDATGVINIACDEYHVPANIQEHIDYITPGIKMMTTRKRHINKEKRAIAKSSTPDHGPIKQESNGATLMSNAAKGNDLASCGAAITPACVMAMYNITAPKTKFPGNALGIFEDIAEYYDQPDLNSYFKTLATNVPSGYHPICKGIDGAQCGTGLYYAGAEAILDLTASIPYIYPQDTVMFSTDDGPTQEYYYYQGFFNNFFDGIDGSYCEYSVYNITGNSPIDPAYPNNATGGYNHPLQCGAYKPTNVISISYGLLEANPAIPLGYQKRQCNEILKLGLQGITTVVSSGDSGVGSYLGCFGSYYDPIFAPSFPASCPYATTIGSTTLKPGKSAIKDQEQATDYFGSGGGFSNIFARPKYQSGAVNHFLNKYPPSYPYYETVNNQSVGANFGMYNRIGRGFPDFAAVGWNYLLFLYGEPTQFGGTSLSAPIFASILTRINEARLIAGKSTVGFVNPVLYAHPNVFHDITVGSNPGCGTDGFFCEPGWDPVTGLGTPKFYQMMQLYMSMP